jgi:hypothetical protein
MTQHIESHTKHFTVDPHIIIDLIFQQAGSVEKALLELVMNEIDAKASRIDIDISSDLQHLTVSGNGNGFTSMEDIDKLFGCFGFNHNTAEEKQRQRDFGRFGLGRGQIFAFGRTQWQTNEFGMTVDLQAFKESAKGDDLPYEVKRYPTPLFQGCKVDISLYKSMSLYSRNQLERNLKDMIKYVKPQVFLNGQLMNEPMGSTVWSAQTDTLAFKVSSGAQSGLSVYNKGVFVRSYGHSQFGISGVLTSTSEAFDVNMARNDIQQATCALWQQIPELVKPFREKQQRRKTLTDDDRLFIVQQILAGEAEYADFGQKKLFQLASGNYASFSELSKHAGGVVTMPPSIPSLKGESLHSRKMALVLSCDYVKRLGFNTPEALFDALRDALTIRGKDYRADYRFRGIASDLKNLTIQPFSVLEKALESNHEIVPESEQTPTEKIKLRALQALNLVAAELTQQKSRKLLLGISETANGWTDGMTYIAIEKDILRKLFNNGATSLGKVLPLLVHEYCHQEDSMSDHGHDAGFDRRMRNAFERMMYINETPAKTFEVYKTYFAARRKAELPIPAQELERVYRDYPTSLVRAAYGDGKQGDKAA